MEATASACVDTAPVGDGWGWDGSQSCRVDSSGLPVDENSQSTSQTNSINELSIVRSQFGIDASAYFPGENRRGVAFNCAPTLSDPVNEIYFMLSDGTLHVWWEGFPNGYGLWSGGWDDTDLTLTLHWRSGAEYPTYRSTIIVSDTEVILAGSRRCTWVSP